MKGYHLDDLLAKKLNSHNFKPYIVSLAAAVNFESQFVIDTLVQMLKNHPLSQLQKSNIYCILIYRILNSSDRITDINYVYKELKKQKINITTADVRFTIGELEHKNYIRFAEGYKIQRI